MAGFNWVDLIIVLILANAVYNGIRIGFLTLLFTFGGFFGCLFLLGWILPHIIPIHLPTVLVIIYGNLLFIASVYVAFRAYDYGSSLHHSFAKGKTRAVESAAGITLSLGSAVIIIWLISASIASLPFVGLSDSVDNSRFIQFFNRHLPPAPAVFEEFSSLVNPNTAPQVYVKNIPNSSSGITPLPIITSSVRQVSSSVVRITGFGCNGIVSGSGFAIGQGLIATNAHVIAGVKRPIIKYGLNSWAATPVLFDPDLDFAVLRVNQFHAKPLMFDTNDVNKGTPIDTIGYPNDIYAINGGEVQDSLQISGPNIYGLGTIIRNIYVIRSPVAHGLSGGPVVLPNGTVAGVIFARPASNGNYGYVLTASSLTSDLMKAETSQRKVGTGACIAN